MIKYFGTALALLLISAPITRALVLAQETKGSADERADQLLAELTPQEKISLLSGGPGGFATRAVPRLGIAGFTMSDGPQGVRNGPGTPPPRACAFPAGVALAATWDSTLAAAYGKAIGLEDRARGTNFQLGPGLNICRVPVNGRNFEYFGEDPYLASIIAAQWVSHCSAQGSVPTIKHFAGNNQETERNFVDAQIDVRTLNEIYLPAFRRAVAEGGVVAVMCSYNRLNDHYASNNDWLLNQTLKTKWGFPGLVMSDWGASHATSDLAAGLDLEMPNAISFTAAKINAALADGALKQSEIDGAVHRLLRTAAAQGWLDGGWQQKNSALPLDSDDSAKTALDVAEASIVLLKNENQALPLDRSKIKTIVIAGPNASAAEGQMPINIGGGGSGAVTPFAGRFAEADYLHGITHAAGSGVKVIYLPAPTEDAHEFDLLANARTVPNGQRGLTLAIDVTGNGPPVQIAPSVQTSINLSWKTGQLPLGIPAGRDATLTWTGVLVSPRSADYEIRAEGAPAITVEGQRLGDGAILHLDKDKPASVTITLHALANPPAGRGGRRGRRGRGGAGPAVKVALISPLIPDLRIAKDADAAIVCVGLNRNVETEGMDRPFDLPDIQQYLISSMAASNPRTIVINNSGAGVGMASWQQSSAAIVQAWYLGQEGGIAIGKVLFGEINPSGHLVCTFDRRFEDNPAFAYYPGKRQSGVGYSVEPYTEGIFYGYRGYDKSGTDPLFPFGFGLSYTTFDLSNMDVSAAGTDVKVSLDVKNTGARAGSEIVQIYVGEKECPIARPLRELKGFDKVTLDPGQSRRIDITLPAGAFSYWSSDLKDWTVDHGHSFNIEAAVSERDIRQTKTISY